MDRQQLIQSVCEFTEFVREIRDFYPSFTDDQLVNEIASLLEFPVERISPLVRYSLDLLRCAGRQR